jgi:hypothetical protein
MGSSAKKTENTNIELQDSLPNMRQSARYWQPRQVLKDYATKASARTGSKGREAIIRSWLNAGTGSRENGYKSAIVG